MKQRIFIRPLLITALLLLPVFAYSMRVSFYLGQATVTRSGKMADIKSGDIIKAGDVIKTGKGGIVEVLYDDDSKITIQQNTVIQIGSKDVKGGSDITIIAGEIKGKFGKLKKGVHRINSPTTVCSVRGTEFDVSVSRGGDSLVNLSEGSLDVDNAFSGVKLEQGQSIETELGDNSVVNDGSVNTGDWQSEKNEEVTEDIVDQAEKYQEHFSRFGENNSDASERIQGLSDRTKSSSTKEELDASGVEIIKTEEDIEHDMLMSEASRLSVRYLMEDYQGTEEYVKLEEAAKKGDAVSEQIKKNYESIQNIKKEYKKAHDKIMKKFKDDKNKIFKNLEDFKNNRDGAKNQ